MKNRTVFIASLLSLITNGQLFGISSGFVFGLFSSILVTNQEVYARNQGALDFAKGFKKYLKKDYVGALSDFDNAIKKEPNYARYYALRALTKYELKDYKSALSDADKSIYLMPNNAKFYIARGLIKQRLLDREGACIDWRYALSNFRSDAKELVKKYCQSDRTVNKTKVKEVNPEDSGSYYGSGNSIKELLVKAVDATQAENYYEAIYLYNKILEINPNIYSALEMRSLSKMELKDFKGALLDIKKAIEMHPFHENVTNGNAYILKGFIYSGSGDVKNACSNFEKALNLGDSKYAPRFLKNNCD